MFVQSTIQTPLADKLKSIELKNDLSEVFKKGLCYFNNDSTNTNNNNIKPTSIQKLQKEILFSRFIKEDLPPKIAEAKNNYKELDDSIKKMPKLTDNILHELFTSDILLNVKSTMTLDQAERTKDIEEHERKNEEQNMIEYPDNYFIYKLCCGYVDLDRIDEFADTPRKK